MSVAATCKRYMKSFSPKAIKDRIGRDSSDSFSTSFVTASRFWCAANSIWATLVVAVCVAVAMRLRIDKSWLFIAFVILLTAGWVFWNLWKSRLSAKALLFLIPGVASAGYLLWPCLTRGAFVSLTGDTFLYTAFGQYLVDHHRGLIYGLSQVDQYAAGLSESRFASAAVLGLLSVLFRSTTAEVLPVYILIVLVNIFSGFVLLGRRFGGNRLFSVAAGLLAVIGGWTQNALSIGGLDNLLFLSLFPFVVIRLELYRFGLKSWSTSLGLAIVVAAVFYAYPEGLAIAGAIFLPFFCQALWSGIYRRGKDWRCYLFSACLVLILVSPYLRVFFETLFDHFGIGMARGASGIFSGLLSARFLTAMFGFGQEYPWIMYSPRDLVLPVIMLVFILLGCATWIGRRKSLILASLILIMMAMWQGLLVQYDYGLYKVFFLGTMIWIPALFRGASTVASFAPRPAQPLAATLGTIIFFSWAIGQRMEQQEKIPWREVKPVKWYSELASLRHKVGNRPVLLICDGAFDHEYNDFDQEWAAYFLRHVNLRIPEYFGYLASYVELLQRAKSVDGPAAFLLINKPIEGALWNNERFSLFQLDSQAQIIGVQGANGLEQINGKPFLWLGNNATRFLIVSNIPQTASFSAWESLTGPTPPENKDRQIRISIGDKVRQERVSGELSVEVPLKPGLNFLDVACQDLPAVSAPPSGDSKALPIGLWDYRITSPP
jgi:hypothetical protein